MRKQIIFTHLLEVLIRQLFNYMFNVVIFDWKRTLYDPEQKCLIAGVKNLLENFKRNNVPMVLIGKGGDEMNEEVNRLGVGGYFKQIIFAEGAKDLNMFMPYISEDHPKKTLFIGDRVRSELEIGKKLGVTTIWVKQGKFATELPLNPDQQPDYIVPNLNACRALLESIFSQLELGARLTF